MTHDPRSIASSTFCTNTTTHHATTTQHASNVRIQNPESRIIES